MGYCPNERSQELAEGGGGWGGRLGGRSRPASPAPQGSAVEFACFLSATPQLYTVPCSPPRLRLSGSRGRHLPNRLFFSFFLELDSCWLCEEAASAGGGGLEARRPAGGAPSVRWSSLCKLQLSVCARAVRAGVYTPAPRGPLTFGRGPRILSGQPQAQKLLRK